MQNNSCKNTDERQILSIDTSSLQTLTNGIKRRGTDEVDLLESKQNEKRRKIDNDKMNLDNHSDTTITYMEKSNEILKKNCAQINEPNHESSLKPDIEPNHEHTYEPETIIEECIKKKVIRNGSISLSNIDSEEIEETMLITITYNSSESEESINESGIMEHNIF